MSDRKRRCPCGSGKQYGVCCYQRDRARADLAAAAVESRARLDRALTLALPLVESERRSRCACVASCNDCCRGFIRATRAEALAIAAWLADPANAATRARIEARLGPWLEAVGESARVMEAVLASPDGLPADGPARDRYVAASITYETTAGSLCPFNGPDGLCEIYPLRPLPCRAHVALGTSIHCRPGAETMPDLVMHPEISAAIVDARVRLAQAGRGHPDRALPNAVADALR